jgi:hypothetical protein
MLDPAVDSSLVAAERAITRLLVTYNRHIDDSQMDLVVDLFAPDGTLRAMGREAAGHDELRTFFGLTGEPSEPQRASTVHQLSNVLIDVDIEAGTAVAGSDFTVVSRDENGISVVLAGRYVDTFTNLPVLGWRIASRQVRGLVRPS